MPGKKFTVCHIQCLAIIAGAQRTMLQIFDALDRDKYEPVVICQGKGPLTEELDRRNIRSYAAPNLVRPIHPWCDWKAYHELKKLFAEIKPDIVHTHSSKPGIVGRLAAHHAKIDHVVHHVQGYAFHEFSSLPKKLIFQTLEAKAAKWADRIIFVSEEERQSSIDMGWVDESKAVRIPNVVDRAGRVPYTIEQREAKRRELGLEPGEVGILFVGRIDDQKQPEILVPIVQKLLAQNCKVPWKFIVAGDGPRMNQLQASVAKAGVSSHLKLLGWSSDPHGLFQSCDMLCLPSLWEGLPLVIIEAFGAGLPIVASNIKGNRELVTEDVGYLCAPRDADSYIQPLKTLIEDPELRKRLGQVGLQQSENYELHRVMKRVEALYDELTGNR